MGKRGRLAALHEAGHFVAGLAQGRTAPFVSINLHTLGGLTAGHGVIKYGLCVVERSETLIRDLAGSEAERHVSRASIASLQIGSARDDYRSARDLLESVHRPYPGFEEMARRLVEEELEQGRAAARDLVRKHWKAIDVVASALLSRGRVSGRRGRVLAFEVDADLVKAEG